MKLLNSVDAGCHCIKATYIVSAVGISPILLFRSKTTGWGHVE